MFILLFNIIYIIVSLISIILYSLKLLLIYFIIDVDIYICILLLCFTFYSLFINFTNENKIIKIRKYLIYKYFIN